MKFKCGIEIHQQLNTKKLFCNCPSININREKRIERILNVGKSEFGVTDKAAIHEKSKNKRFVYISKYKNSCLVELDEEPPHEINKDALIIALQVCKLFKCKVFDETYVMRKIVVDGSNTTGFQRTLLIGIDGSLEVDGKIVGIKSVCLEEDSCKIVSRMAKKDVYDLERLSVPLIEIATDASIDTFDMVRKVAYRIGKLLRSFNVKRGIGSIRQDINVSINDGPRIEIKGVQELKLIDKVLMLEVERQKNLMKIKEELKEKDINANVIEVSNIFRKSRSNIFGGKKVFCCVLKGMSTLFAKKLNKLRTVGKEVSDYVKARELVGGIVHTDESIEKYKIEKEIDSIRKTYKIRKNDLIVLAAGNNAEKAIHCVIERVKMLKNGVIEETRKAKDNGDTEYMRPLPTEARMYPETDTLPIKIMKFYEVSSKKMPETIDEREKRYTNYFSKEISKILADSKYIRAIDTSINKKLNLKLLSKIIVNIIPELKLEGIDIEKIENKHIIRILEEDKKHGISKEIVKIILINLCNGEDIEHALKSVKIIDHEEVRKRVREIVMNNRNILKMHNREKIFMGMLMKEFKGNVDGSKLIRVLREIIKEVEK